MNVFTALADGPEVRIVFRDYFASLHAPSEPLPIPIQIASGRLWNEIFHLFCSEYDRPPPARAPLSSANIGGLRDSERGVAGYSGGYAVCKEIAKAERGGPNSHERQRMLRALLQPPGTALPATDQATIFLLIKERFGKLTRLKPAAITACHLAQERLRAHLSFSHILEHGNSTFDHAVRAVRADPAVREAFFTLLLRDRGKPHKRGVSDRSASGHTPDRTHSVTPKTAPGQPIKPRRLGLGEPPSAESAETGAAVGDMDVVSQEEGMDFEFESEHENTLREMEACDAVAQAAEQAQLEEVIAWESAALLGDDIEEFASRANDVSVGPLDREWDSESGDENYSTARVDSDDEPIAPTSSDEAIAEGSSDEAVAEVVLRGLLRRLFNIAGKEFKQRVLLIWNAAKSDTQVALRTRLKVASCKEVSDACDAPVTLSEKRGDLRLPRSLLFELLIQCVEFAPGQLANLKVGQIELLIAACSVDDAEAKLLVRGKKEDLLGSLIACLHKRAAAVPYGFARVGKLDELACFALLRRAN